MSILSYATAAGSASNEPAPESCQLSTPNNDIQQPSSSESNEPELETSTPSPLQQNPKQANNAALSLPSSPPSSPENNSTAPSTPNLDPAEIDLEASSPSSSATKPVNLTPAPAPKVNAWKPVARVKTGVTLKLDSEQPLAAPLIKARGNGKSDKWMPYAPNISVNSSSSPSTSGATSTHATKSGASRSKGGARSNNKNEERASRSNHNNITSASNSASTNNSKNANRNSTNTSNKKHNGAEKPKEKKTSLKPNDSSSSEQVVSTVDLTIPAPSNQNPTSESPEQTALSSYTTHQKSSNTNGKSRNFRHNNSNNNPNGNNNGGVAHSNSGFHNNYYNNNGYGNRNNYGYNYNNGGMNNRRHSHPNGDNYKNYYHSNMVNTGNDFNNPSLYNSNNNSNQFAVSGQFEYVIGLIVAQIEYYFSIDNLCKDLFMRRQMNSMGLFPLATLANFNRVKSLTGGDYNLLFEATKWCANLEVIGDRIRPKLHWDQWVLPMAERLPAGSDEDNDGTNINTKTVFDQTVDPADTGATHVVASTSSVTETALDSTSNQIVQEDQADSVTELDDDARINFNVAEAVPFVPKST
ncbi:hypothetical protein NADFUDRAFT_68786 [Nadsonia fulvescens var. elongata DSM 6958]|uniref:HTH La-type RNA-binding domain-containing protein n=1 Tax=Nadsonia fulvescens var. elongata DSM 6958 TaxID=857566 RepID=A0A1E3PT61_9ASCO|nr:hypothetical protein NADFUDRAFT_68786 [Nadsonia fulvescens var. elongata DSM 6958]